MVWLGRLSPAGVRAQLVGVYAHCLFCHADLGRNAVVEAFPVGRRLAYDQHKGRLWVVCRRCERWNLTPQEERWEAMEQAERLYRGTRLRAATDNVGLARLGDGTELVRIGTPLRPEFAAWRYGDQFGRRRNRHLLLVGGATVAVSAVVIAGPVMGLFSLGGLAQLPNLLNAANFARRSRRRIVLTGQAGVPDVRVSLMSAERTRLELDDGGFAIVVPEHGRRTWDLWSGKAWAGEPSTMRLTGPAALAAASRILPHVNQGGGARDEVRQAVDLLDEAGGPEALFRQVARDGHRREGGWSSWVGGTTAFRGTIKGLAPPARLALEMAAHEESERRALEGELQELDAAWRRAEEIAAIADDLLLPSGLVTKLDQLRGRSSARTGAASSPSSDKGGASSS